MTWVGDLGRANGVKNKQMELSNKDRESWIGLLLDDLAFAQVLIGKLYDQKDMSDWDDDFIATIVVSIAALSHRKTTLLARLATEPPCYDFDSEEMKVIGFWLGLIHERQQERVNDRQRCN
jgi:hypothetical protein